MRTNSIKKLAAMMCVCTSIFTAKQSFADEAIEYGYCKNLQIDDIPYGDFSSQSIPQAELGCPQEDQDCTNEEKKWQPVFRITQVYNQPESEKWYKNGVAYWGHDGIDLHEKKIVLGDPDDPSDDISIGAINGENAVIAIQGGKVIVATTGGGWGYHMSIATRIPFSHQIITVNYAHMHPGTLKYGKCAIVQQGAEIDALKEICPPENFSDSKCDYPEYPDTQYKEFNVGDTKVFTSSHKGGLGGDEIWGNAIAFEKGGIVYTMAIYIFNIAQEENTLSTIVESISAN